MGGVARRATFIKQEREAVQGPLLVLDAGSTLFGYWPSIESEGRILVEAMNAMGYDAMAVGEYDLYMGPEILQQRIGEATFAVLSANLQTAEGEPITGGHTIIEWEGGTFGIIGLTEPEAVELPGVGTLIAVQDPIEIARTQVEALRAEVDVLIVLSHLGLEADMALAETVPGIDIIVGGRTLRLMQMPERINDTIIVQQGYAGEWIGRLTVTYDADWGVVSATEDLIALDESLADDPALKAMRDEWARRWPSPTPEPTPTASGSG